MTGSGSPGQGAASGTAARPRRTAPPAPIAVDIAGACELLGVSWDTWREHVAPYVPVVRLGRSKRVRVSALEQFLRDHEERLPT